MTAPPAHDGTERLISFITRLHRSVRAGELSANDAASIVDRLRIRIGCLSVDRVPQEAFDELISALDSAAAVFRS
jgi:hypothetical protein